MALGGGYFTNQNKVLPGAYINFISRAGMGTGEFERGIAAFALEMSWGPEQKVRKITSEEFIENTVVLFGCRYDDEKLKGLRDLFSNINTLYAYRLNSGGVKAKNSFGEAKYAGVAGNQITIVVLASIDDENTFEVQTIFGNQIVDKQTVSSCMDLKENDFVSWKTDATLKATASEPMTGGTDGAVDGEAHQNFLNAMESCHFHAMGTTATDEAVKRLYTAYQIRMREEAGKKFQTVLHDHAADYEGVVNVKNDVLDKDWPKSALVYFTTGMIAGCALGESNTNRAYTGEFTIDTEYTQYELERSIQKGEFIYHNVGDDVRVLMDLNSLVTLTEDKGTVFKRNETICTTDDIATYTANLFTGKYLGKIRNDPAGRVSFHTDLCLYLDELVTRGAITGYDPSNVTVSPGKGKTDIIASIAVETLGTMEKLYMTCIVG